MVLSNSHHSLFGLLFFIISLVSLYRVYIYKDFTGRGKVVTIFYNLIFITSFLRFLWFSYFSFDDKYFLPIKTVHFGDDGWKTCLFSEILMSLGSIGIYLIFILIACYWNQLLRETSTAASLPPLDGTQNGILSCILHHNYSMTYLFYISMSILLGCSGFNILLFISKVFHAEDMILYDAVMLTITSLITLVVLSALSQKIQELLIMIGAINSNSTQAQIRRIIAITYAANFFFICRVGIEMTFLVMLLILSIRNKSFSVLVSNKSWDLYLIFKFSSEIIILILELFISTAIKTYASTHTSSNIPRPSIANRRGNKRGSTVRKTKANNDPSILTSTTATTANVTTNINTETTPLINHVSSFSTLKYMESKTNTTTQKTISPKEQITQIILNV